METGATCKILAIRSSVQGPTQPSPLRHMRDDGRGDARLAADWLEAQSIHPFLRDVAAPSLVRLALQRGESVLDVGCGTVFFPGLAAIVGTEGRVVGLDHSAAFLEDARNAFPMRPSPAGSSWSRATLTISCLRTDVRRGPLRAVLMHLTDPASAIPEIHRVSGPAGAADRRGLCAGARMDHPDPEAEQLISAGLVSGIRNPSMGIALRGLGQAGFTDVDGEVVGYFEESSTRTRPRSGPQGPAGLRRAGCSTRHAEAAIMAMEDSQARPALWTGNDLRGLRPGPGRGSRRRLRSASGGDRSGRSDSRPRFARR